MEERGRLLTTEEVGDLLGCGAWRIREWVKSGELPVVRLSHRVVRYFESDVHALAERHRITEGVAS